MQTFYLFISGVTVTKWCFFVNAHELEYQAITTSLKANGNEILLTTDVAFAFDYDSPDLDARLAMLTDYFTNTFFIEQENQPCSIAIDNLIIDEEAPQEVLLAESILVQKKLRVLKI